MAQSRLDGQLCQARARPELDVESTGSARAQIFLARSTSSQAEILRLNQKVDKSWLRRRQRLMRLQSQPDKPIIFQLANRLIEAGRKK